jgi:DNA-binding response OmpR family regulator
MSGKILLVEDNELIQANNKAVLERNGYTVRLAMNLAEARKELADGLPDAVVLDITLPDGSGLEFLKELRQTSQIPVLLLTAMGAAKDTAAGLDAGSDDYLAKPYNGRVFRARVDALMRRAARVPETVKKGRLTLDVTANAAALDGTDLLLTQKEFALLLIFVQNEERFISGEYLYEKVWKAPMASDSGVIRKTMSTLRGKIKGSGWNIAWSRGEGYCFERD